MNDDLPGFTLAPDDDWPDPDDPRWYQDDDGQEALATAERNPSLLHQ